MLLRSLLIFLLGSLTVACQDKPAGNNGGASTSEGDAPIGVDQSQGDGAIQKLSEFIASKQNQIGPGGKIDLENKRWRTELPKPPQVEFTKGRTYFWNLDTNKGKVRVRLMPDVAPMHVSSTVYLTLLGYYDGLLFHRVIPGFMAQGGCPLGNGAGSPGYGYGGELDPKVRHDRPGLLSMANSGPNTDGSQFFLTFAPTPWLDGLHTLFGEVEGDSSMQTLKQLERFGTPGAGRPTVPLKINKATITVE